MATRTRPFVVTAAALASAASVVLATPDLISTRDLSIASAPSPTGLSSASYELTAFSDISIQGISDAYWFGWGGFVGCGATNPSTGACTGTPADFYYPTVNSVYVSGYSGILYYLIDNAVDQFNSNFDLDNYYFEIGQLNGGNPNAGFSGLGSLFYVGIGELFGTDSAIFKTAQSVLYYGVTNVVNSTIVSLATALVPEVELGPLTVGGGILASLYYFGSTPDGSFQYQGGGLPAIWSYISTALTSLFPASAAATADPAAATALAASAETVTGTALTAKAGLAGAKSEAALVAPSSGQKADTTDGVTAAEGSAAGSATITDTASATGTETTGTATTGTETTGTETTGTETTGTATTAGTGDSTTSTATSTDAGGTTTAGTSTDTSSTDTKAPTSGTTGKITKPKAQNPVGKIAGKIKSALGGDSSTGGRHRADGTGNSSAAASSSSSDSAASSSSTDK